MIILRFERLSKPWSRPAGGMEHIRHEHIRHYDH
jgi:hypothetical protein